MGVIKGVMTFSVMSQILHSLFFEIDFFFPSEDLI